MIKKLRKNEIIPAALTENMESDIMKSEIGPGKRPGTIWEEAGVKAAEAGSFL